MPDYYGPKDKPYLLNYASIIDPNTLSQALDSAKMSFIQPYLALMPDAHLGLGATVGSVIPTVGAIMPAAVGVDIGCGMQAVQTQWHQEDLAILDLHKLHADISRSIPLSAGNYNAKVSPAAQQRVSELEAMPGIEQAEEVSKGTWRRQLGSLGSGNHFIEVSLDENDQVWLFLHSGSRGVGNRLAQKWIKVSQVECTAAGVSLPNRDLAYLTEGTESFEGYLEALNWAQRFAALNRDEMMDRVVQQVSHYMGAPVEREQVIRCHHNYTEVLPNGTYLSRKGAIAAYDGTMGLIPGSMGDRSYVVRGLGNPQGLFSAPHGAGRNHSRSAAKRLFTRADLDEKMAAAGTVWGESDAFIDEIPQAYKPIDQVMQDAKELVEVVHELRAIINVKGN